MCLLSCKLWWPGGLDGKRQWEQKKKGQQWYIWKKVFGLLGSLLPQDADEDSVLTTISNAFSVPRPVLLPSNAAEPVIGFQLQEAAGLLQAGARKVLSDLAVQASQLQTNRFRLQRSLLAIAEASSKDQQDTLEHCLRYAACMQEAKQWEALLYLDVVKHDETPLKVQAQYHCDEPWSTISKVFVVERRWCCLLRKLKVQETSSDNDYLLLHGCWAPATRVAQNSKSETMARLISGCPSPSVERIRCFTHRWRLTETDSGTANFRTERLMAIGEEGKEYTGSCHGVCLAHRCHSVATSTLKLMSSTASGAIATLLVLQSPGALQRFRDVLVSEISCNLTIVKGHVLSEEALSFRTMVTELFTPGAHRPRARAVINTILAKIFNSDWRTGPLSHVCASCCSSPSATRDVAAKWVVRLLRSLQVKPMCRADWQKWLDSLNVLGLLGNLNRVFRLCFVKSFSGLSDILDQDGQNDDDSSQHLFPFPEAEGEVRGVEAARWRQDFSKNLKKALAWWESGQAEWNLILLRSSVEAQRVCMSTILHMSSSSWEQVQLGRCIDTGCSRDHACGKVQHSVCCTRLHGEV